MPIVPLIRQSAPLANAAAPVLDRERRPTLDTSSVQRGLLELNDARKMPLQDPATAAAPYEALGSVGRALQQTGSLIGALAIKRKEAESDIQIAEADARMSQEQADFTNWKVNNPRPEAWEPEWKTRLGRVRSELTGNQKLNAGAREQINLRMTRWEGQTQAGVAVEAATKTFAVAQSTFLATADRAREAQNPKEFEEALNTAAAKGYLFPHQIANERQKYKEVGLMKGNEAAENQFKTAMMMGDEKMMEAALQVGKERAGWDEDFLKVKRLTGMDGIQRTKAVNQSRSEAEFLGSVMMRKAQGDVIVPAQIENWVKENKIDKQTGARLLVAVKSEQGAMQGEFYDFLNDEVDAYDPKTDPDGVKSYELQKKAAFLGVNSLQWSFFQARLENASKLNGPQRAQQAVLSAGKKAIGAAFKDVGQFRAWDSDAESLFKDPAKLEAFGIPNDAAKAIEKLTKGEFTWGGRPTGKGVDKAQALQLFRQNATTRVPVKPDGLTEAEWSKMVSLADGDTSIDPRVESETEFNRAILEEELESWYNHELNKRGTPPTEQEVKTWVGDKTRAVLQGEAAANIFKMPTSNSAGVSSGEKSQRYTKLPDGGYEGIASSYGYEGDEDNGFNSLGMLRGKQPWYGELPTVALAPSMAEELGVELPRKKKDGTWDWSKSVVEVESNGQKTKAIYDENGMYLVEASKNKLIDLTPEASAALHLSTKNNAKVTVRKPQS